MLNEKYNLEAQLLQLREFIIEKSQEATGERLKNNPQKTELEVGMGCYAEELEEQVRDAVILMNKKGYKTFWSGWELPLGAGGQVIKGFFKIEDNYVKELNKIGVTVEQVNDGKDDICEISFITDSPDTDKIKSIWDKVASILPDCKQSNL
jgi:hypothetical protein